MREFMNKDGVSQLSRRDFIALAGLGAAAVAFAPRFVFAQKKGIVQTMIDSAAQAKIETHTLRRISAFWKARVGISQSSQVRTANFLSTRGSQYQGRGSQRLSTA
jgi:hypothetical protein